MTMVSEAALEVVREGLMEGGVYAAHIDVKYGCFVSPDKCDVWANKHLLVFRVGMIGLERFVCSVVFFDGYFAVFVVKDPVWPESPVATFEYSDPGWMERLIAVCDKLGWVY